MFKFSMLYCGICRSDYRQVRNEQSSMPIIYSSVSGYEIVGGVTKVGTAIKRFKPGDLTDVGCLVDSDDKYSFCKSGLEQFCPKMTLTYNSPHPNFKGVTY